MSHLALNEAHALAMCNYWTKKYLCGCDSHVFRERCQVGLRSDGVCDVMKREDEPRKSHFQCYDCIKGEVEQEKQHAAQFAQLAEKDRNKLEEQRRKEADKARQLQVRAEAAARAKRENDEAQRRAQDQKAEAERAKREGGLWVDAGSTKKGKGRKASGGGSMRGLPDTRLPPTPVSAPPAFSGFKKELGGVFGPLTAKEPMMGPMGSMGMPSAMNTAAAAEGPPPPAHTIARHRSPPPKTDLRLPPKPQFTPSAKISAPPPSSPPITAPKGVDPGGRAGRWGPKSNNNSQRSRENQSPKKILKNDSRSNGSGEKV
jgi:hypothetical protein